MDSDCLVDRPVTRKDFIDDEGRVLLKKTPFADLAPNFLVWKNSSEPLLREDVPYETMTGFPIVYPRDLYQNVICHVEAVHDGDFLDVLRKLDNFNEFTPLGHFLVTHMPGRWVNTKRTCKIVNQARSWDGLTPEVAARYERTLRDPMVEGCP